MVENISLSTDTCNVLIPTDMLSLKYIAIGLYCRYQPIQQIYIDQYRPRLANISLSLGHQVCPFGKILGVSHDTHCDHDFQPWRHISHCLDTRKLTPTVKHGLIRKPKWSISFHIRLQSHLMKIVPTHWWVCAVSSALTQCWADLRAWSTCSTRAIRSYICWERTMSTDK